MVWSSNCGLQIRASSRSTRIRRITTGECGTPPPLSGSGCETDGEATQEDPHIADLRCELAQLTAESATLTEDKATLSAEVSGLRDEIKGDKQWSRDG